MAKKIEIIGQALVVTDTVTSEILIDLPKSKYYFRSDFLERNIIKFVSVEEGDLMIENPGAIPLSESVDSGVTPFTASSFRAFARTNLGFNTASGGSGAGINLLGSDTVVNILAKDPSNTGDTWVALDTGVDDNGTAVAIGDALATNGVLWTNVGPIEGEKGDTGNVGAKGDKGDPGNDGIGDVTKVGTPANNQIAVWTGDGTLKGDSKLTYDGSLLKIDGGSAGSAEIEEDDIILVKAASGDPSIKGGNWQYKTTLAFDTSGMTNNAEITLKNESGVNALISDIDNAIANIPSGGGSANVHSITQLTDLTGDQSANGNKIWSIQDDIDMGNASITLPTGVYLKYEEANLINGTIDLNGGKLDSELIDYRMTFSNGTVKDVRHILNNTKTGIVEGIVTDPVALQNKERINKIFKQLYDLGTKGISIGTIDAYFDVWGETTNGEENVLAGHPIRLYPDTAYSLSDNSFFRVQPTDSLGAKLFVAYVAHNTIFKGGNLVGDRALHDYSQVFDNEGTARHTHGAGSMFGIIGCHNLTVKGTNISEGHGDGMGIAGTEIRHDGVGGDNGSIRDGAFETRNLLVSNVTFFQNRRNNVSVVDGFNIKFENCDIEGAGNGYTITPDVSKSDFDGIIDTWVLVTPVTEGYSLNNELGQILEEGVDYTFDGTTITYTTAPANGVTHRLYYYDAGGYAPRYGIDIEPYRERNASGVELLYEITSNITISTCTFKNNYSGDVNMFKGESVRVVNNQMDNRLVMLFGRENEIVGNTFRYNSALPLVTPDRVAITATSAIVNNEGVTEEIVYSNTIKDNVIFDYPVGIDVKGKGVSVTGNEIYEPTVLGIHFNGIRDSHIINNTIEATTAISAFKSSNNFVKNVILDKNIIRVPLGIGFYLDTVNTALPDNRFVISNSIIDATTSLKNRSTTRGLVYDNNYANCPTDVQNLFDFEIKNNTNSEDATLFWSSIFNLGNGVFENNRVSGNHATLGLIRINTTNTANAYLVEDIVLRNNYLTKTDGFGIIEFAGNEANFNNIEVLSNYYRKDGNQYEISGALQNSFITDNKTIGSSQNLNITGTGNTIDLSKTKVTLSSVANSINWTGQESELLKIVLDEDATLENPTNPITDTVYQFLVEQDNTGLWVLSFGSNFKFKGGSVPAMDLNANSKNLITCIYDGTHFLTTSIENFL